MNRIKSFTLIMLAAFALIMFQSSTPECNQSEVKHIMRSYRSEAGFIGFGIPAGLVRAFIPEHQEPELKALLRDVRMVRFLINDGESRHARKYARFCAFDMMDAINTNDDYKKLLTVKSANENVSITMRQNPKGMIKEILIMVQSEDELVAVEILGNINPQHLVDFANKSINDSES
ncbi:MAG: DUF4252 domain-containing protein, partial [Bacteroidota bacterium]